MGHPGPVGNARSRRPIDGRIRVTLPEDLTLAADDTTGMRLRRLATDARIDELLLVGHDVQDVSMRGLGLLVAVVRLAAARGALAVVVDPSPALARLITSLGLTERLLLAVAESESPSVPRTTLRGVPSEL